MLTTMGPCCAVDTNTAVLEGNSMFAPDGWQLLPVGLSTKYDKLTMLPLPSKCIDT